MAELWLMRHGETAWSCSGRHTGRTDVALTTEGERHAVLLGRRLAGRTFALVLTSPLRRARETCCLAGLGDSAHDDSDLLEWDYGSYEGRTSAEIRQEIPGWTIWNGEVRGGESADEVGARADRVIRRCVEANGDAALFAHGHVLRILAARWVGLAASAGRLLSLDTASLSILGYEHDQRVVRRWNDVAAAGLAPPRSS